MRKAFVQKENTNTAFSIKHNTPMIKKIEVCNKNSFVPFPNEEVEDIPYVDCEEIIIPDDLENERISNVRNLLFLNPSFSDSDDDLWSGEQTDFHYSDQSSDSISLM
ncbi:hypothetical protein KM1_238110 [Entamoeba histolytica HM-3:IMSS]|uniref:Uncharacterized protein n=6 Tax=Entamoeba histolytica TaxID=5759 RepID=C4M4Y4_ENTH1|nr:hypothetical protein EHI_119360 [Entamoeba histolytica HM-1:IMSS]EMD45811.1 Hypothetical protein EHI5A_199280 [Entamoeba histolytica KU27]EMS13106.1 hypothetical protein KM1_238110 [Entamoeba histolytica HM-3:IMSS]ENY65699.1 hypothetical protein EHI7A_143110 [Entamoeba histolytica HM-1:IMSS-A]GAT96452.1 hypothetical protein CL6EHI_119360 [Entamoeba histolytica]EAL44873.1 hypothetical protein EHI_119360 [Entamoeba histolytica HM-1:IMSS]|eukprot:XP_650259.1 hypothetical protein EHI_119360 [Entamoeba histolytica HM-1:IMSS]